MKKLVLVLVLVLAVNAKVSNEDLLKMMESNKKDLLREIKAGDEKLRQEIKAGDEKLLKVITANKADSDREFALMKQKLDQVDKRLDQIDKRLEQVDKRLDQVDQEIAVMKNEQKNMHASIKLAREDANRQFMYVYMILAALIGSTAFVVIRSDKQFKEMLNDLRSLTKEQEEKREAMQAQQEQQLEAYSKSQEQFVNKQFEESHFNQQMQVVIDILKDIVLF